MLASGSGLTVLTQAFNAGDSIDIPTKDFRSIILLCYKNVLAGFVVRSYARISIITSHSNPDNYVALEAIMDPEVIRVTFKRNVVSGAISYKVLC